eukprot:3581055-Alexandrium_andersonii.AAC.1
MEHRFASHIFISPRPYTCKEANTAGIALVVSNDFPQRFGGNYRWGPVVPGYIGVLTAWGDQ